MGSVSSGRRWKDGDEDKGKMMCREGGRREGPGSSHDGKVCTQIHLRIANTQHF